MFTRAPFLLAILGMIGGVFIAILFAVNEDMFRSRIENGLAHNAKVQQIVDPTEKAAKVAAETEKTWRYYQRFHFHATGIGAMMMALLLFLRQLAAPRRAVLTASWMVSVGGFLYPFVWLFAALYGPQMGRAEAKEAFAIFGYMGGLFLVGGLLTLALAGRYRLRGDAPA
ncbi:MAG: hypothetical protein ABI629_03625 [bacterium]